MAPKRTFGSFFTQIIRPPLLRLGACAIACVLLSSAASAVAEEEYVPDLSTPEAALRSSIYAAERRHAAAYLKTQAEWIRRRYGSDPSSQIEGLKREWAKHIFPVHAVIEVRGVEFGDYPDYQAVVTYDEVRDMPDSSVARKTVRAAMALEDRLWRLKYAFIQEGPPRAPGTEPYGNPKKIRNAETIHLFK